MKKITKFVAVAIMMMFGTNSFAQITRDTQGYQRAEVSFVAENFKYDNNGHSGSIAKPKGFALGYIKGISLTNRIPLFLELGGRLNWTHKKESSGDTDYKYTFMSVSIPVQAAYKFTFSGNDIAITPFFGPNFRFNFYGRLKTETGDHETKTKYLSRDNDDPAKIFQFGLNLGCGFNFSRFYLGYTFQPDLSSYIKYDDDNKYKTIYQLVSVGINF